MKFIYTTIRVLLLTVTVLPILILIAVNRDLDEFLEDLLG